MPDISGAELNKQLKERLAVAQIPVTEKCITGIYRMKNCFVLLVDQEGFEAIHINSDFAGDVDALQEAFENFGEYLYNKQAK